MIVSLCDYTGNMVRPWAEAGHTCFCVDTKHSIRRDRVERVGDGQIVYRWGDVRAFCVDDMPSRPQLVFAFPPCTNLAVSGARDFQRKGLRGLIDGLELVEACRQFCAWSFVPWMMENPISRLSSCWRKPDHIFQPWQYGDNYTKATCLWTGGGFVMPDPIVIEQPDDVENKIHNMPPSSDRAEKRSATPEGFARAVFVANRENVK